jgi:hypothetical protein
MIKSQDQVLADLQALHLSAVCTIKDRHVLSGHTLALLTLATQWDVREEFLSFIKSLTTSERNLLETRA